MKLTRREKVLAVIAAVILFIAVIMTVCYITKPTEGNTRATAGDKTISFISYDEDKVRVHYLCGREDDGKQLVELKEAWEIECYGTPGAGGNNGMVWTIQGISCVEEDGSINYWMSSTSDPRQPYVVVYNVDGSIGSYGGMDYSRVYAGVLYTWEKEV